MSCLASRTGAPKDARAIDHQAHVTALAAARAAGVSQVVLLSAICVQKPLRAFQHAKLAFEKVLIDSGVNYLIVRATAFFKSLSGQIERVKKGKLFLVFGDGLLTACKPSSDGDLGAYLPPGMRVSPPSKVRPTPSRAPVQGTFYFLPSNEPDWKAKPGAKPVKLSDGKGLYLLVTPAGPKLRRWKYRVLGKEKILALGAYPTVSLAQARERQDKARKVLH